MSQPEREYKSFLSWELKEAESGRFTGYASTYARDLDGDRVAAGAFGQSIKDTRGQIPILMHHDPSQVVGLSVDLAEDSRGLFIEAQMLLDTTLGKEAWGLLKGLKALDFRPGLSIGFITKEAEWDEGSKTRVLKEVQLFETSITLWPANRQARVDAVKSLMQSTDVQLYTAIRELIAPGRI